MENDVYTSIRDFHECVWNKPAEEQRRSPQYFLANGLEKFAEIDILRPLPKTSDGIYFILLMTDSYLKLGKAVVTSKTTAAHILSRLMDHYITLYGIADYVLTDN